MTQGDETLFWLVVALLATVVMFGTVCSYLLARHLWHRRREGGDPALFLQSFKPQNAPFQFPGDFPCRWLAIKALHPAPVLEALPIARATPCSWEEGLARTFNRKLFVSPPINGWILVLGGALPDPAEDIDRCYLFLTGLSRKLGHVQFFNMNRTLNHHAWVIVDKGHVVRAYAWGGQTLWNEGPITPAEIDLELASYDYGESPRPRRDRQNPLATTTERVPQLAARWGMDPAALSRCLTEDRVGLAGELRLSNQG